ncbi:DUF2849 domain-containing protein [Notoacmeibacter sp. MSK16QG-6]|uniref:DUF2849 domain-containing protein n=1 Tax=Notoacmeibacter sp. MSK16QG-6 TaxID=2957982 RepID=UPI00209E1691|nr:DUF2849 domain-containing protein [Notoacmeibacter sp. MSK16QG-6]MCP1198870.1 DUF2849 domain-containing protein [Notoacmeibacter sp. MSK16QG-6]
MSLKVLTANRLMNGEVVYYNQADGWMTSLADASATDDPETVEALEKTGAASADRNEVVDVNLIDVLRDGDEFRPIRLREIIRAKGPTTHPQFAR